MVPGRDRFESARGRLQYAAGRIGQCPEGDCPLWEPGGGALKGSCGVEQLDLTARPELVSWLLMLRKNLEEARTGRVPTATRRLFYRLVDGSRS